MVVIQFLCTYIYAQLLAVGHANAASSCYDRYHMYPENHWLSMHYATMCSYIIKIHPQQHIN